jgi:hypothetical protein
MSQETKQKLLQDLVSGFSDNPLGYRSRAIASKNASLTAASPQLRAIQLFLFLLSLLFMGLSTFFQV